MEALVEAEIAVSFILQLEEVKTLSINAHTLDNLIKRLLLHDFWRLLKQVGQIFIHFEIFELMFFVLFMGELIGVLLCLDAFQAKSLLLCPL